MNPMAMGGIDPLAALAALASGQQAQPQPQAQAQEAVVDSPLARALAYAQQQQAQLGPAPQMDTSAASDMQAAERQRELANALMGSEYVPNSGAIGALAQTFSAYKGGKLDRQAGETMADALKRQAEQQNAQAQYAAQVKAFEEGPGKILSMAERAKATGYEPTAAELASGEFRKEATPKGFQASGGFLVNKDTGESRPIEGYMEARERIAAAGRSSGGGGGQGKAPSGYRWTEDGDLVAIKGGPADKPADAPDGAKPLTPDQALKASLFENAARAATDWQALVLDEQGGFNDIEARKPQAQALLRQAISAKLRAESGAAISKEEIANETERYMGSLFSSDATNVQQARALTEDLQTQLGAFGGQGNDAFARGTGGRPAPAAAAPIQAGQNLGNGIKVRSVRPAAQ